MTVVLDSRRDFTLENSHGNYHENSTAHRSCRTYALFFGLDQTAANGMAGFLQVGYHWRKVGAMPGTNEINDNGTMFSRRSLANTSRSR